MTRRRLDQAFSSMTIESPEALYTTPSSSILRSRLGARSRAEFDARYEIVSHLGSGAFATVDQARDRKSGLMFAAKHVCLKTALGGRHVLARLLDDERADAASVAAGSLWRANGAVVFAVRRAG